MTMQNINLEFIKRVRKCIEDSIEKFGVHEIEDAEIRFDLKGHCAGQAMKKNGKYILRFNPEAIEKDFNDMANNNIPHEVAHLVCFVRPMLGRNHDRGWKNVCVALGGSGERTHSIELSRARKVKRYVYSLDDGTEILLTKARHNKVQAYPHGYMYMPAKYTKSKVQQPIGKVHFVNEVTI